MLLKIADAIDARADELARIENDGQREADPRNEGDRRALSSDHFRYFAGALAPEGGRHDRREHDVDRAPRTDQGRGADRPVEFPLLMGAWKLAPALAAGDTVVIKSSSTTPLVLFLLAEIVNAIRPAGTVNVISGKGSVAGDAMLKHPGFAKLAFTARPKWGRDVGLPPPPNASFRRRWNLAAESANIAFADADMGPLPSAKAPRSGSSSTRVRSAARARGSSSKQDLRRVRPALEEGV